MTVIMASTNAANFRGHDPDFASAVSYNLHPALHIYGQNKIVCPIEFLSRASRLDDIPLHVGLRALAIFQMRCVARRDSEPCRSSAGGDKQRAVDEKKARTKTAARTLQGVNPIRNATAWRLPGNIASATCAHKEPNWTKVLAK